MKSRMILNKYSQIFSTIKMKNENAEYESPTDYYTLKQAAKILSCTISTVLNNVIELPDALYTRQQYAPNSKRRKIFISQEGMDRLKSSNYVIPNDFLSASQLCKKLDIVSPTLYAFIYKYGFYDRALKIGSKKRRFYRVMFSPELANEILEKYHEVARDKKSYKKVLKLQPISDFLDDKFITPDFMQFIGLRTEVRHIDGVPHVPKSIRHKQILDDYMRSVGFISAAESALRLGVSRQRVHQIIAAREIKDDESICVKLSSSRISSYISEDFIETFLESKETGPPDGYYTVATLAGRLDIKTTTLRGLISQYQNVQYIQIGTVKYFEENAAKILVEGFKSYETPKHTVKREAPSRGYNVWYTLTEAAMMLRLKNKEFIGIMETLGLNTKEYVRSRNGSPYGKHKLISPVAVQIITDNGYAF